MSQYFTIHPFSPQLRLLRQAVEILRQGGVVVVPTDSCYALCCHLDDRSAVTRVRRIRQVDAKHHLTLLCRDLSEIAQYAQVNNRQYRLMKSITPGPYTFILEATREVPHRLSHPSRRTIGLRVPENPIAIGLLAELGQPLLGTTLILTGEHEPLTQGWQVRERLERQVDLVLDGGACGLEPTTVVDLTAEVPVLVRAGRGSVEPFGFTPVAARG